MLVSLISFVASRETRPPEATSLFFMKEFQVINSIDLIANILQQRALKKKTHSSSSYSGLARTNTRIHQVMIGMHRDETMQRLRHAFILF